MSMDETKLKEYHNSLPYTSVPPETNSISDSLELTIVATFLLESLMSCLAIWPMPVEELGFAHAFLRAFDTHSTTSVAVQTSVLQ